MEYHILPAKLSGKKMSVYFALLIYVILNFVRLLSQAKHAISCTKCMLNLILLGEKTLRLKIKYKLLKHFLMLRLRLQ